MTQGDGRKRLSRGLARWAHSCRLEPIKWSASDAMPLYGLRLRRMGPNHKALGSHPTWVVVCRCGECRGVA